MAGNRTKHGSVPEFDANWKSRKESTYNHWTKHRPHNQIQLAFRRHWLLFQEMMHGRGYTSCLEVGCGRGSISSYFAENGFHCTLLDSSISVLATAKAIFATNGHHANFVHGDALAMPFRDGCFDVVVSIGLLEHFQDIQTPVFEQFRVSRPGGMIISYIVPERPDNIQRYFNWLNRILGVGAGSFNRHKKDPAAKTEIYRSDYRSERYLSLVQKLAARNIVVTGVYPLPMISHSPEFPFSLLPPPVERVLTRIFEMVLMVRKSLYKRNPWLCDEKFGQAFLVACKKGN